MTHLKIAVGSYLGDLNMHEKLILNRVLRDKSFEYVIALQLA